MIIIDKEKINTQVSYEMNQCHMKVKNIKRNAQSLFLLLLFLRAKIRSLIFSCTFFEIF